MASWHDILPRLEEGLHRDKRLHVESIYRPAALPGWLHGPWQEAKRNAGERIAALLVNCKGTQLDDTTVMLRLSDLEKLLADPLDALLAENEAALDRLLTELQEESTDNLKGA